MAFKYRKGKRPIDKDQTTGERRLASDLGPVPNSAMSARIGLGGTVDNIPNSTVSALQNQRPAAEAEADRLSAGITSTTPEALRREMGERLGADLSGVRFHSNTQSEVQAGSMGARAFTKGSDVYFGDGGFNSEIAAHELVHTVQQGAVRGSVSQNVPMGTAQMWPWSKKSNKKNGKEKEKKIEKVYSSAEEKAWYDLERLFRIQAGLNSKDPDLVSDEDRKWYEKTLKNPSYELIREILKRRDEKGVDLMNQRRNMAINNTDKSKAQLNYEARNTAAAYDMNIYHMLAKKASKNANNFLAADIQYLKSRDRKTAATVNNAYALMRDRTYNQSGESMEKAVARKQDYKELSQSVYKNPSLYVNYSDSSKISKGWSNVVKNGNTARIAGETDIKKSEFGPGNPKSFAIGEEDAAREFFGFGNNGAFDQWRAGLKPEELQALTDYTGTFSKGSFGEINEPLRKQLPLSDDARKQIAAMNNAMSRYELDQDLIVYRGCRAEIFGGMEEADKIKKHYVGRIVRDRAFVSTSAVKGKQFANRQIQLIIRIPRGKGRGAFLSPFSKVKNEHEFLIRNGASFLVKNAYTTDGWQTFVEMDLVT